MPVKVHFRRMSTEDFLRLLLPFIISFLIGICLKLWHPSYWWLYGVPSPLADAFIVAGIIGVGLELVATKFLIESAADDLAQRLVGMALPRELQKQIVSLVNETKIVRDHYVTSYIFSEPVGDRVTIEREASFDVRNYSNSAIDYTPEMDEEACFQPKWLLLEYGIQGHLHSLGEKQLTNVVKGKHPPSETTRLVTANKRVRLESIHDNPKAVCSVRWKWRVQMPIEFSDTIEFRNATLGATVHLVSRMPGLTFESNGDNMQSRDEESLSWVFDGPFIGGQQIRTRWFRTSN